MPAITVRPFVTQLKFYFGPHYAIGLAVKGSWVGYFFLPPEEYPRSQQGQ